MDHFFGVTSVTGRTIIVEQVSYHYNYSNIIVFIIN